MLAELDVSTYQNLHTGSTADEMSAGAGGSSAGGSSDGGSSDGGSSAEGSSAEGSSAGGSSAGGSSAGGCSTSISVLDPEEGSTAPATQASLWFPSITTLQSTRSASSHKQGNTQPAQPRRYKQQTPASRTMSLSSADGALCGMQQMRLYHSMRHGYTPVGFQCASDRANHIPNRPHAHLIPHLH